MPAIDFNADEVEPRTGFDPLPAGKYPAVCVDSEEKPTKAGTGSYIQFTFEVLDGEYKGRRLWARLNLNNPSQTAVDIARTELSALCRAVGVKQLKDTAQLHDIPLVLKVAAKKDADGEVRNEVKGYEPAVTTFVAKVPTSKPVTAPWQKAVK
jgi:hypothetical protein